MNYLFFQKTREETRLQAVFSGRSTKFNDCKDFFLELKNAPLAQLVEHLTLNQGVPGSSP